MYYVSKVIKGMNIFHFHLSNFFYYRLRTFFNNLDTFYKELCHRAISGSRFSLILNVKINT